MTGRTGRKVLAIGLDSADPCVIEQWMSQGHLKTLSKLRQNGAYGRLHNWVNYHDQRVETKITERVWGMFLSGCLPDKTGYWGPIQYQPDSYGLEHDYLTGAGAYDFVEYPPFYALGETYNVGIFDVPGAPLSNQVNGVQVLGWGGHAPCTPSVSSPQDLLPQVISKYGKNPILNSDHGFWWDTNYFQWIQKVLKDGSQTRADICSDFLKQKDWDFFMTVFAESHTAGHDFWQLSHPSSPFYSYKHQDSLGNPMLKVFTEIDQAIDQIVSHASPNTYIVVFSLHGMGNNISDLSSMMFLPELMYRFSFPGHCGLAGDSQLGAPVTNPVVNPRRRSWSGEIWQTRYEKNPFKRLLRRYTPSKFDKYLRGNKDLDLKSPYQMLEEDSPLFWMPAMWYQGLWPKMKAFALPSVGSGHIRINLEGRDPHGIVHATEYDSLCESITATLMRVVDARTQKPLVSQVIKTRNAPLEDSSYNTDADLVVIYNEDPADAECMTDTVDSPELGRIGPVTYCRFGGHRPRGFAMISGPDIAPGTEILQGQGIDLAPTILNLLQAPIPSHLDGQSLLSL